ncbi:MAG: malate dehydrogenase [Legionellales bacterium RIFCSPHIGHO2_12_FULL_37_14]|nr:MAG: malate dehydrogenase [Legionellales bacterium RIFCSPHIGHO2_12_FULL_37_14]
MKRRIRVAVTGAAGQIGYALIFRIASGQMFGLNAEVELNLIELEPALPALEGVKMELDDCAFPLLKRILCTSSLEEGMKDANWVILVGSIPRKQGMERSDLLQINGNIFKSQGEAINKFAAENVHIFVVGNPCNTNCLILAHHAPNIPRNRFYAMTSLDELRSKSFLARKADVDVNEVTEMAIWGNHSSTQFPDFYHAKIDGLPAPKVIKDLDWLQETFIPAIQQRGAQVIKARGASSAASAANAIIYGVNNLVNDTKEIDFFSMCTISKGEYGVDEGLVFSFPARTINGHTKVVENIVFEESFAKEKFQLTLNELRTERDTVKELGLLD